MMMMKTSVSRHPPSSLLHNNNPLQQHLHTHSQLQSNRDPSPSSIPYTGPDFVAPPLGYATQNVMLNANSTCCDLSCASGSYAYIVGFRTGLCYIDGISSNSFMYGCKGSSFSSYLWTTSAICGGNPTNESTYDYPECFGDPEESRLTFGFSCVPDSEYNGLVPYPAAMGTNAFLPYAYYFNDECSDKPFEYYVYEENVCYQDGLHSATFSCENSITSENVYDSKTCTGSHHTNYYDNYTSCTSYSVNKTGEDDDVYEWDAPAWFQSVCSLPNSAQPSSSSSTPLSSGAIAGIVIAAVVICAALCLRIWYSKQRSKTSNPLAADLNPSNAL
jgi:hypothetical protein